MFTRAGFYWKYTKKQKIGLDLLGNSPYNKSIQNLEGGIKDEKGIQIGKEKGIEIGKEKGIQIGIEKGIVDGRIEGENNKALEIAKNLLNIGLSVEQIIKSTGLSKEEIKGLINDSK